LILLRFPDAVRPAARSRSTAAPRLPAPAIGVSFCARPTAPGGHLIRRKSMSDVGRLDRLARSRTQLPVYAYFDETLFSREMDVLFKRGPGYVGHERMVPEPGDYC